MENVADEKKDTKEKIPRRILEEDDTCDNPKKMTPTDLMNKQLDTFYMFNNVSSHEYDPVDKLNMVRMLGGNHLQGKTMWEIYDDMTAPSFDKNMKLPKSLTLYDNFVHERYPLPGQEVEIIGTELTATDLVYDNIDDRKIKWNEQRDTCNIYDNDINNTEMFRSVE